MSRSVIYRVRIASLSKPSPNTNTMNRDSQINWLRRSDVVLAYTFLRILLGVNFFNHGFTRMGNIPGFAQSMVDLFQDTFIPEALVRAPAFLVPIVELIAGGLLAGGFSHPSVFSNVIRVDDNVNLRCHFDSKLGCC